MNMCQVNEEKLRCLIDARHEVRVCPRHCDRRWSFSFVFIFSLHSSVHISIEVFLYAKRASDAAYCQYEIDGR